MGKLEWRLKRRQEVAEWYYELLKPLTKYIELPTIAKYTNHSFWMFNILLKDNVKISRDELMNKLGEEGIETRPIFYPMHTMPPYFENKKYLIAEKLSAKGISTIQNIEQIDRGYERIDERLRALGADIVRV